MIILKLRPKKITFIKFMDKIFKLYWWKHIFWKEFNGKNEKNSTDETSLNVGYFFLFSALKAGMLRTIRLIDLNEMKQKILL